MAKTGYDPRLLPGHMGVSNEAEQPMAQPKEFQSHAPKQWAAKGALEEQPKGSGVPRKFNGV